MDMSYLAESFYALVAIAVGVYLLFYLLYRRSLVSVTDPLNLGMLLMAFYLAGVLMIPAVISVNWSYTCAVILTAVYIFAGALFSGRSGSVKTPQLGVKPADQVFVAYVLAGLQAVNLIINQIFGVIPLLKGVGSRSEYGTVALPTLFLLAPDLAMVLFLMYLLTDQKKVRKTACAGVVCSVISTILGGGKSAIFNVVYLFIVADYIWNIRLKTATKLEETARVAARIKRIRRYVAVGLVATIGLLPLYLVKIGADSGGGSSSALQAFAVRLFGGFDGIAIVAYKDIDLLAARDVHLTDYYFYPLIKKISHTPEFQSAGEYLIYQLSGSYAFSVSGMNPNSTLSIELLLSNGSLALSGLLIALVAFAVFRIRTSLLRRDTLRVFDLILWTFVVMAPFSVLLDGTYFVIRLYMILGIYAAISLMVNAVGWLRTGRMILWLL